MLTINKKTLYEFTDSFLFLPTSLSPQKSSNQLCNQFFNTTICTPHPRSLKLLLGSFLSLPHFTLLGGTKAKTARRLCGLTFLLHGRQFLFLRQSLVGSLKAFHCRVLSAWFSSKSRKEGKLTLDAFRLVQCSYEE